MITERIAWLISKTLPVYMASTIYIVILIIVVLITRAITIQHYLKHHLDELAQDRFKELTRNVAEYSIELNLYKRMNEDLRVRLKAVKAAAEVEG